MTLKLKKLSFKLINVIKEKKKIISEVPNYTFDMFVCPSVCDIDINYHN